MKRILTISMIILIFLYSCKKEETAVKMKSGYFVLTELKKTGLKSANEDSVKTTFSLGEIKASREYFFILSNGGDNSIYAVEFQSDDSFFNVSPSKIGELAGSINKNENLIPLVSLGVIHGTQLNGVGYTNLLPMGFNSANITVSGKIIENGDTVKIQSAFTFQVNAKVMDVKISENNSDVDLTSPSGYVSSNLGGLGFIRFYELAVESITISNIGNVNINCKNNSGNPGNGDMLKSESKIITVGNSINIALPEGLTVIELEGNGTISDDERIQLGNNGRGYFGIINNTTVIKKKFFDPANINLLNLENFNEFWAQDTIKNISDYITANFDHDTNHLKSIRYSSTKHNVLGISVFKSQESAINAMEVRINDVQMVINVGIPYATIKDKWWWGGSGSGKAVFINKWNTIIEAYYENVTESDSSGILLEDAVVEVARRVDELSK